MAVDTILQISSGRGPAECRRAVFLMTRELAKVAENHDCSARLIEAEPCPEQRQCLLSALVCVSGESVDWTDDYVGTHLWVCKSPFRPTHGRKNWYFGIARLPSVDEIQLNPQEVRYQAICASGPGGQHVNKTATAVRATWLPDGTSCVASGERSQHQNKRIALARLQLILDQRNHDARADRRDQAWTQHNELQRGDPCRTYRGARFQSDVRAR